MMADVDLVVLDGFARAEFASLGGLAAVAIASIALSDCASGVSDIGKNTLKCCTYATISDALINKFENNISKLEKNKEKYGYVYTGDYVVYNDIKQYNNYILSLCISRDYGEKCALDMNDHHSVHILTKLLNVEDYFESVNNNREQIKIIKSKY